VLWGLCGCNFSQFRVEIEFGIVLLGFRRESEILVPWNCDWRRFFVWEEVLIVGSFDLGMSSFFNRASLDVFKERTLQRVQEQLEQVGVKNEFIEKRARKLGGDEELTAFLDLVESLHASLERIIESATVFHKGACVMQESGNVLRGKVGSGTGFEAIQKEVPILEAAFDEQILRNELQENVTKPIRLKLKELTDERNRIKEAAIMHLEASSRKETVERLRGKKGTEAQLGKAEDAYAEKQVQYEQTVLKLKDEFAELKRDHEEIFSRAFNSFKLCQYRFIMTANACLSSIANENEDSGLRGTAFAAKAESNTEKESNEDSKENGEDDSPLLATARETLASSEQDQEQPATENDASMNEIEI